MIFIWIMAATFLVSAISLIGVFTLVLSKKTLDKILVLLIGFAAGGLIGGAFLHLLPESIEKSGGNQAFFYALIGFSFFFMLERIFHWRHCHEGECDIHAFTYLNLLGDGIHNFIDGMLIASSFLIDFKLGLITTLLIICHEIPQEIGDFGILVSGGFTRTKALFFNFLCALTAMLGATAGYFLSNRLDSFSLFLLPFTAGGFIYIASSDLIPELHKQKSERRANLSFLLFLIGVLFLWLMKVFFKGS